MLKRLWRWLWPLEANATPRRHGDQFATMQQLEEALEEHMKSITFEWNEWYEKFDKLHLRLAKRESRAPGKALVHPPNGPMAPEERRPSVLDYRKPWSV